ncbi:poly-gamma-glutamate hydrolase family protein [Halobacillus sp. B23F22_1]|uniref:poly-gamma-glutamate hydrolase family protein n=1 Tax=Halobacillus sp. B23F22_1 TaxID=3459514 RepID=UPI00373EDDCB
MVLFISPSPNRCWNFLNSYTSMGRISWGTIAMFASVLLLFFVGTGKVSKAEDCGGDRFCSFQELNEVYEKGEDWEIEKRTDGVQRWLVSAIHGGGIEVDKCLLSFV